jgi:hypothetical protein
LELTGGQAQDIALLADEREAITVAKEALLADLSFEHLRRPDDAVWQFVGQCWVDRTTDHVPAFIEKNSLDPLDRICFIPVEHLAVAGAIDVLGLRLLPTNDPHLPKVRQWFSLEKPIGCVAAVPVVGTNYGLMAERAQFLASHALRVMRIALREHFGINDWQLRFRIGMAYVFDDSLSGWHLREDQAFELGLGGDLITMAQDRSVSLMPAHPTTDIGKKADLALRWMERAWFTGEPLVALLYLFFALEALLGDKSEGLKAHGLAFRQTMLSYIVEGNFTHPNQTWFLYDRVRSGAVHGEDTPDVEPKIVHSFAWDVRKALNQYLALAEGQHFTRRGHLLSFLDQHPHRPQLIAWLRQNGGQIWTDYLDHLEGADKSEDTPSPAPEEAF